MSILDVTEDQIFQTLGKGRDPNFKPIEKARPEIVRPKNVSTLNQTTEKDQSLENVQPVFQPEVEREKTVPEPIIDENMKKLAIELNELNNRVEGIQKMVKWYIMPQFAVIIALLIALFVR